MINLKKVLLLILIAGLSYFLTTTFLKIVCVVLYKGILYVDKIINTLI